MKAIILAAGKGTRLSKYTQSLPKGMLSIAGKTIIERQIELYRKMSIDDIIVIRGYESSKISYSSVRYYDNYDYDTTNMVASLLCARDEFDDDIIISYSDVIFDEKLLKGMIEAKVDFGVAVDTEWTKYWEKRYGDICFDIESLRYDHNRNIYDIGKDVNSVDEIDARYVGLLKFSQFGLQRILELWDDEYPIFSNSNWKTIPRTMNKAYMTDLLQRLIDKGNSVEAIEFSNGWLEFDTNEDFENVLRWIEEHTINEVFSETNFK